MATTIAKAVETVVETASGAELAVVPDRWFFSAAHRYGRAHTQPAANEPSNNPSSKGVQTSGIRPTKPIESAKPATTMIVRRGPEIRRPSQAPNTSATTRNHRKVSANVASCSSSTSCPGPSSHRNRTACSPCGSKATRSDRFARSPRAGRAACRVSSAWASCLGWTGASSDSSSGADFSRALRSTPGSATRGFSGRGGLWAAGMADSSVSES